MSRAMNKILIIIQKKNKWTYLINRNAYFFFRCFIRVMQSARSRHTNFRIRGRHKYSEPVAILRCRSRLVKSVPDQWMPNSK